jgi:hypothetical protein
LKFPSSPPKARDRRDRGVNQDGQCQIRLGN